MKKVLAVLTLSLVMLFPEFIKAESNKVAVVDLQKILNESSKGREAVKLLESEFEKRKKSLDAKEEELKKLEDEITKRSSLWSDKIKQEKEEEFDRKVKDFRRLQTDLKDEFQRKNKNFTDKILMDIIELVKSVGEEEKFSVIMEKQNAIFTSSSIDITDKVIKLYDNSNKSKSNNK